MKLSGNTILITGGGSGIGRELAHEFYRAGNTVIIAGRRQDVLRDVATAHPGMFVMPLDLADAPAIADFAARIAADHPRLNVLINNSGVMFLEDKIDLPVAEATITTNLLGPIRLTSALLPHLTAQPRSTIVNVSSSLAFVPYSLAPTYCATKAALHSWSLSMREQLRATSVEVVELIPPAVQTELLPGQSNSPHAMPLDAFIAETMMRFRQEPTPEEVCGAWAESMRCVVNTDKFGQVFQSLDRGHDI